MEKRQAKGKIIAKWHYITDDIHILDYNFDIYAKEGVGSVSLSMPKGKKFPSSSYRIGLALEKNTLRSFTFKIK